MSFEMGNEPNSWNSSIESKPYLSGNLIKTISNEELFQSIINNPKECSKAEIRIGYGISETAPSPRVLAYCLPAVSILQYIFKQQFNKGVKKPELPTLTLYSAAESVSKANNLDIEKTLPNRHIINQATFKFIQHIAPEIVPCIQFKHDEKLEDRHEIVSPTIQYLMNIFETGVENGEIDESVVTFLSKKQNRSESVRYMVEHSLYASDNLGFPLASLFVSGNELVGLRTGRNAQNIIMIGGESEELFYQVRNYLTEKATLDGWLHSLTNNPQISAENIQKVKQINNNVKLKKFIQNRINKQKRVQIISSVGAIPAYQPPSSDITIESLNNVNTFENKLKKLRKEAHKNSYLAQNILLDMETFITHLPGNNLEEKIKQLNTYFQPQIM